MMERRTVARHFKVSRMTLNKVLAQAGYPPNPAALFIIDNREP